ncbi:2-hydroxy-3-oxopropionate reductase [Synechococcus sp. BL107]|uniref:NAD(P)-dependent oxidoreductase n=1 Tax=Synechococcus sp. BL107 TaxID=313625 RepID=UPI0000E53B09|nr:NAD(P)-dependent oxidoreductase [Synechococcus sp. BL107]EAU71377.1 2-hydroxy-3-oxopropionate reductase [Synechococcus sp. BL107]
MTRRDLRVGVIGLGALGLPMAANLRRADVPLRVHTRSRSPERDPSLQGSIACATPAEAAEGVDVLLVCVSDNAAVEAVLFGANGASSQLAAGSVVVDCSTIAPATAIALAQRLARQGVDYVDAPVTGGTEGAKAGSLTVLVGGEPAALERARPVLEIIGGSIHHFGPVGRGQQVKAVNQVLVAGSYAAVAEAMALGQRLELPMEAVVDALQGGAAGSWALSHRAHSMLMAEYPLGFRMALHHKDLGIALDAADDVNLDLPVTQLVANLENNLMERGHGDEDVSALHRHYHTKS